MPPSQQKYNEIKFLYAQRQRENARRARLWLVAWWLLPPSALAIGFTAGRLIAHFHLFGS